MLNVRASNEHCTVCHREKGLFSFWCHSHTARDNLVILVAGVVKCSSNFVVQYRELKCQYLRPLLCVIQKYVHQKLFFLDFWVHIRRAFSCRSTLHTRFPQSRLSSPYWARQFFSIDIKWGRSKPDKRPIVSKPHYLRIFHDLHHFLHNIFGFQNRCRSPRNVVSCSWRTAPADVLHSEICIGNLAESTSYFFGAFIFKKVVSTMSQRWILRILLCNVSIMNSVSNFEVACRSSSSLQISGCWEVSKISIF